MLLGFRHYTSQEDRLMGVDDVEEDHLHEKSLFSTERININEESGHNP